MATYNKKSKAELAATAHRKKRTVKKPGVNSGGKNSTQKSDGVQIPPRLISSAIFLAASVLLLVTYLIPDGTIPALLNGIICGLFGKVGFVCAIPACIYLFTIHAFSNNRPILSRSICVGSFVLTCSCLFHLSNNFQYTNIGDMYFSGVNGSSAGLVFGSICEIIRLLLGDVLSYILLLVAAVFTLLGAMQITIPGIIKAVQARPRLEEDEKVDEPEPASILVNHIAEKRIERKRQKKERLALQEQAEQQETVTLIPPREPEYRDVDTRANEIVKQIQADVEEPVAAASGAGVETSNDQLSNLEDAFPENMPELMINDRAFAERPAKKPEKVTSQEAFESAQEIAAEIAEAQEAPKQIYEFPPIDLLRLPNRGGVDSTGEMRDNTHRLQDTLASFKIEARIVNVTRGPSVTRYEVELEKGVRLNKLTNSADDIALSLGASGVRIAAVPGKISVVGIEVPNKAVTAVTLREVIDSPEFEKAKSSSSFAVGKDIAGNCVVGNVAKLPHMLIAGTTGSGKSVCMNSIIISLLYKASPEDVKLIMIDPKMVELGVYNEIPHLLIPVVTDPKKAAGSLQWAVTEMMRRYKAMSDANVRDLDSYNSMVEQQQIDGDKLPQVVVIIDELADLMLVAAKEVEESICRIAQMGRASGIHLVIATQRPSADVITGLMKANIPSRIAFAVASAMESRIILDTQGAEKLVGRGDMLYAPIGSGKPLRVQGCYVSEQEVEAVATHVKSAYTSSYNQQIMDDIERKAAQSGNKTPTASDPEPTSEESSYDELLPSAVDVVLETNQASASMLQRRLKLGYSRASRIIDQMAELGIVGPYKGSKPRDLLITKEQWKTMRERTGSAQMDFDEFQSFNDTQNDF